ncbi:MAG TPA: ABC transporter ATP-binding protein [Blastocatellia bacterium]|jgi:molybdate transport system ATP-binding protein|nr:ABC transporter ATP-binding protein [Blastocatellia bacterium]
MLQVSIRKQIGTVGKQLGAERRSGSGNNGRETGQPFRLDVNFTAPSGVTILFGPSGSGKTTCLRAVAGIVTPDEGRISLDERLYFDSASGVNLPIQRRRVGFVFQDYVLFPHLTAEQNVAYGIRTAGDASQSKAAKRERSHELLSLLGIEYVARQYPRELSGGESQRVALARALASDPAIVLLDEPLSAVDAKTRARLLVEIKATQQRTAIPFLYVTHSVAEVAEIGDQVIVLNMGRVIRQGSPREVPLVQVE